MIPPVRPQHIPRPGHALNRLWTPSDAHSPSGSGVTVLPGQQDRWNVARLLLWLHFPTPPYPMIIGHWHALPATLSFQWLVWVSVALSVESLSPTLFSQDKLNLASSGLIRLLVSKTVTQLLGKLNSISPS